MDDPREQILLVMGACDYAENVLRLFEERYPDDHRPRKAIEAGRASARGEITIGEARKAAFAAHAAAREAEDPAAIAAARSAAHAVATAHVIGHARHAADYAEQAMKAAQQDLRLRAD